jgi:hypothetical protein
MDFSVTLFDEDSPRRMVGARNLDLELRKLLGQVAIARTSVRQALLRRGLGQDLAHLASIFIDLARHPPSAGQTDIGLVARHALSSVDIGDCGERWPPTPSTAPALSAGGRTRVTDIG